MQDGIVQIACGSSHDSEAGLHGPGQGIQCKLPASTVRSNSSRAKRGKHTTGKPAKAGERGMPQPGAAHRLMCSRALAATVGCPRGRRRCGSCCCRWRLPAWDSSSAWRSLVTACITAAQRWWRQQQQQCGPAAQLSKPPGAGAIVHPTIIVCCPYASHAHPHTHPKGQTLAFLPPRAHTCAPPTHTSTHQLLVS